ncbi:MAG: nitroreductase family protein [Clostridiaceae bacterium]
MNNSITEIITKRKSIRNFDKNNIDKNTMKIINDYIKDENNYKGPLNKKVKIKVVDIESDKTEKGIKLGTYGVIKNPNRYIAAVSKKDKESLIELGFIFEKLVLFLTENGIGTCWLGGTFKRSAFAEELVLDDDEIIPIVTPIGYPKEKPGLTGSLVRYIAKSDTRKKFEELFYYDDFANKLNETDSEGYKIPLEMVRLAPSASNKQPWRVVLSKDKQELYFYLHRDVKYAGNKMGFEMQYIDMGIAMSHFELSAKETNIKGNWGFNDPKIDTENTSLEYIATWKI